jgi:hypothetical protein
MIAGLTSGQTSLRAQPAGEPAPTGGEPVPTEGGPAATGDTPAPADDEPIVTDEPDKPWSQGVPLARRVAARDLLLEGNRLARIPLFGRAAEKYMAALALWKHPVFYFNLALAQMNLGQEVEARESLEQALAYGGEPLGAKEFQEAQKQLQEVKRKLGRIRLTCRTPGAEVTLDGVTVLIGGPDRHYEGWTKAKPHEITAKKAGYQSEARQVMVSAGKLLNVDLSLVTLSEATDTSRRWAVWKPWALGAVGVAAGSVGAVFHTLSARNFTDYNQKFVRQPCAITQGQAPPGCARDDIEPELNSQVRRARLQQVVAIGSYIAGGSMIATSLVLLYLNRPRLAEQRVERPLAGSLTIMPTASSNMLGILLNVSR